MMEKSHGQYLYLLLRIPQGNVEAIAKVWNIISSQESDETSELRLSHGRLACDCPAPLILTQLWKFIVSFFV